MTWIEYNVENIKGIYLYKFLSEKHLIKFLKTGNIWFSRSDKFGDKMECVAINDLKAKRPDFDLIESRKRKHLVSCFHVANTESLAFWDTYADKLENRRVFALRFVRPTFISLMGNAINNSILPNDIVNLIHGKVVYKNLVTTKKENLKNKKVPRIAFRKEYAFNYEREYRFVMKLSDEFKSSGHNISLGNPNKLPFEILINPLLENKDYVKCIDAIDAQGYSGNFELSALTKWLKPELW